MDLASPAVSGTSVYANGLMVENIRGAVIQRTCSVTNPLLCSHDKNEIYHLSVIKNN